MNKIGSLQSAKSKCESPKTPGGISKSLLTPCRRVGLSRKWRNAGPSPFVSPLTSDNSPKLEVVIEKKPSRKKARVINTEIEEDSTSKISQDDPKTCEDDVENVLHLSPVVPVADIVVTPSRPVQLPRKNKSRTSVKDSIPNKEHLLKPLPAVKNSIDLQTEVYTDDFICKPDLHNAAKEPLFTANNGQNNTVELKKSNSTSAPKVRSPNNLTKECVVLIQKKLNKNVLKSKNNMVTTGNKTSGPSKNTVSQTLFDSDSDEAPLSTINKKNDLTQQVEPKKRPRDTSVDDDDDFHENAKVTKLREKVVPRDLKIKNSKRALAASAVLHIDEPSSQESFDNDDDDFDFDRKKTILIRKTYEKVTRPQKAKSTGSITQRDIENLKARIKMKKNQLLAQSMTQDTEELRNLIKKWKRGCQDALVELMDLMKRKCPEKCMQYSEILRMLQIPAGLVGYDSDNDCFRSPDDASIILSKFET